MKNILLILITIIIFSSCRYKDNDKLALQSVKNRLEKTWYLKECILNGINLESYTNDLSNNTLTFTNFKRNDIDVYTNLDNCNSSLFHLNNNKTVITRNGISSEYKLKITKLTKNELWMEGNGILNTVGGLLTDKIKVKYSSKE